MQTSVTIARALLEKLSAKTKKPLDRVGLHEMADIVNNEIGNDYKKISYRYLYDTLYLSLKKATESNTKTISLDYGILTSLTAYLAYRDFEHFKSSVRPLLPGQIGAVEGNWYSIVRCNSRLPRVLVSPVRIYVEEHIVMMELRGPHRNYRGELRFSAGAFSVLLVSDDQVKSIYLSFQIGVARQPEILSGVFASVSTAGAPIAGREILLRRDEEFNKMKNKAVDLDTTDDPNSIVPDKILKYFSSFEANYLKIDHPGTFTQHDLKH